MKRLTSPVSASSTPSSGTSARSLLVTIQTPPGFVLESIAAASEATPPNPVVPKIPKVKAKAKAKAKATEVEAKAKDDVKATDVIDGDKAPITVLLLCLADPYKHRILLTDTGTPHR